MKNWKFFSQRFFTIFLAFYLGMKTISPLACHKIYDYVIELNAKKCYNAETNDKSKDINSPQFYAFSAAPKARFHPFDTFDEKWLWQSRKQ